MLLTPRRLLGAAAGLLLLAPLVPATTATASAPRPADRPVVHRMPHGQAVAALHRARALTERSPRHASGAPGVDATPVLRDLALALRSLDGTQRRTALRLLARPTDTGGDDLGDGALVQLDPSRISTIDTADGHFSVHYLPGTPDPNVASNDLARTSWVEGNVLPALEKAWSTEVGTLGYRAPLADTAGTDDPGNPDQKLDVYLANLGQYGIYGYCTTADPQPATLTDPAYCVIDNDFARSQFQGDPLDSLHATVAHEFFHAVQFGYDIGEDLWFMEGTATWMEHQVYPDSRDFLQYLQISGIPFPYIPADEADGFGHQYGAFLFWQYLGERFGRNAVRAVWEAAAASGASNPYSLQALRQVVAAHHQDFTSFFATFARWNTLPPRSYAMRSTYATQVKPDWSLVRTFSRSSSRMPTRYAELPHLASVDVLFRPSAKLGRRTKLRITLDLPDRSHGSAATVQVRHRDGTVAPTLVRLSGTGSGTATVPFNPRTVRDVVLVMTNASTAMRGCGTGDLTFSCGGSGVYDNNQRYRVSARLG